MTCRRLFSTKESTWVLLYASHAQWDSNAPEQGELYQKTVSEMNGIRIAVADILA